MADGSIKESEGSIHKVAATIMGAESYNGWTYYAVILMDPLL